jgi:hypothetical protein
LAARYLLLFCFIPGFAWVIKRGLMFGGSGASACVPILLDGPGAYAVESRVFGRLPRFDMSPRSISSSPQY